MLPDLSEAQDTAQTELASAEIALAEATARAVAAREAAARLAAAVAALSGESPSATLEVISSENTPKEDTLTPKEFDAARKKRQRAKEKKDLENNPLAHIKCAGCGVTGHMADNTIQTKNGATVRMMVCGKCSNQVL